MESKTSNLLKIKLDLLLEKREGMVKYILSDLGWDDNYSKFEIKLLEKQYKKAKKKLKRNDATIAKTIRKMINNSYDVFQLLEEFPNAKNVILFDADLNTIFFENSDKEKVYFIS